MNIIKYGLSLAGSTVEGLFGVFFSKSVKNEACKESMYEKVAKDSKSLERLFPQGKLDKRLESYVISFVDNESLESMKLVCKSWFLRAHLVQKSRIELNLIKSEKSEIIEKDVNKNIDLCSGSSIKCVEYSTSRSVENVPCKESMYEKVVKDSKKLEKMFPQGKLDKRLESYMISFVDNESLESMKLVCKSWFLRAHLVQKSRIELNLIKSEKSEIIEKDVNKNIDFCSKFSINPQVVVVTDDLSRLIEFLENNKSSCQFIRKLDIKVEVFLPEVVEKIEKLLDSLPNLIELNLFGYFSGEKVVKLKHDKLESFSVKMLVTQQNIYGQNIQLKMPSLKFLNIKDGDLRFDSNYFSIQGKSWIVADNLDVLINFLKNNEALCHFISKIDISKSASRLGDGDNYEKNKKLLNILPNLIKFTLLGSFSSEEVVKLKHDKLESFSVNMLGPKENIQLEMPSLKFLNINRFFSTKKNTRIKCELIMPLLEECFMEAVVLINLDFNFNELSICSIKEIYNCDVFLTCPKIKKCEIKTIKKNGKVKLIDFPEEVSDEVYEKMDESLEGELQIVYSKEESIDWTENRIF